MCERDLPANDRAAQRNRERFREHRLNVVRLMGSPASGKTTLLEATLRALAPARVAVLAADLATDRDAVRLRAAGADTVPIQTGAACHLDAEMVGRALRSIRWRDVDYLFIEEVGNLVCPAVYDLGQELNVVALSVTEGAEKPRKYPTVFQKADLVLLTKIDLLPHLDGVSVDAVRAELAAVMARPALLTVSARTGAGMPDWLRWLDGAVRPRGRACALAPVRL